MATGLVPRGNVTQIKTYSHPFLYKKNFNSGMNSPGRCTLWPHSRCHPPPAPGILTHLRGSMDHSLTNSLLKTQERKLYVRYTVLSKITATGGTHKT